MIDSSTFAAGHCSRGLRYAARSSSACCLYCSSESTSRCDGDVAGPPNVDAHKAAENRTGNTRCMDSPDLLVKFGDPGRSVNANANAAVDEQNVHRAAPNVHRTRCHLRLIRVRHQLALDGGILWLT